MTFDLRMARIGAGDRLSPDEIRELSVSPDILAVGMLADALRRRLHGSRLTYLRVAACGWDRSLGDGVSPRAREIRITGVPDSLETAVNAVRGAKEVAGDRTVTGFSWRDLERLTGGRPAQLPRMLGQLREAGMDAVAELPLDSMPDAATAIARLKQAGFERLRLTVESYEGAKVRGDEGAKVRGHEGAKVREGEGADRCSLWLRASALQDEFACIQVLNPLPTVVRAFRPTTGYDDVKTVALARLAAPNIPSIQVDWSRYGPKLAQVALTFGADDVWGVSASDEAPEGRRRAPLEEIRRNAEAAGFEPVERDGRFAVPS